RPVPEVDRVVQLLLGPPRRRADATRLGAGAPGRRRALDAAGGEERRHAERARACPRGPQHLAAGHAPLGHAAPDGRVHTGAGRVAEISIFSGRTVSSSGAPGARPSPLTGTTIRSSGLTSMTARSPSTRLAVPLIRFDVPMKPATNRVRGCS